MCIHFAAEGAEDQKAPGGAKLMKPLDKLRPMAKKRIPGEFNLPLVRLKRQCSQVAHKRDVFGI
jgi:hypothetical protein